MADERRANTEYIEDVDVMILEYLIHNATKACIDDFVANDSEAARQPSQHVLTKLHILNDFWHIFRAKYHRGELEAEVCLWLELLELLLLISYRHANVPLFGPSVRPAEHRSWQTGDASVMERRHYWFSVRDDKCRVTEEEHSIYNAWNDFCIRSQHDRENKLPEPHRRLAHISPLFFTISAKIASFIDQGISETWVELAAQFMLQTALESCLTPRRGRNSENPLITAFAWGWIPPSHWNHYCGMSKDHGTEAETLINDMFKNNSGRGTGEHERWQETRLKYLSLFGVPQRMVLSDDKMGEQLRDIARQFPAPEFEKRIVTFSRAIWEMCRKPLLVQIEEGKVEGMSVNEFGELKRRIFPA